MGRDEEIKVQDVLSALADDPAPKTLRELARQLGLDRAGRSARKQLQRVLAELKQRGEIVESRRGGHRVVARAAVPPRPQTRSPRVPAAAPERTGPRGTAGAASRRDPNLFTGRIVVHRDGYGFVVPDTPLDIEGDLYVSPHNLADAMHGDRVLARIDRRRPDARAEGHVVRIEGRAHPTVVGIFHYSPRGCTVTPLDPRVHHEIVILPGEELPRSALSPAESAPGLRPQAAKARRAELDGLAVHVELARYPCGGVAPAGKVIEILGRPGETGVDIEIILRKYRLPHVFPAEALAAAQAVQQAVPASALTRREDFRHLPIVTIDGETARDFDDAVYVERLGGGFRLQVHIADVAHYVRPGSPLDHEARLRGNSVYFPDRAIPMLPHELSTGICSLNPGEDRLVMSAIIEFDAGGAVAGVRFTPGVIRSAERMTYTSVNLVLEGDPQAAARYAPLAGPFHLMKELALLLYQRRSSRGAIDFDLPEPVIEFDALGRMVTIARSERNIAHRIIEEFMLAANEQVAGYLERRGLPSLHRVHEKPDGKKVLEFEELARAFGYSLGLGAALDRPVAVRHGRLVAQTRAGFRGRRQRPMVVRVPLDIEIRPAHYQRLVEKITGRPEERILSYLMLRSLKQARYAAEPIGHFALAVDAYTHFTSPIRRYPDLIVHRILKWALEHPSGEVASSLYGRRELEEIAVESSEAERRADDAERELVDWKTAQFMEQRLGEEYEALIVSVVKFGFFVELMELFVEGLVPIDRLEETVGERCYFRDLDHAIVSQHRRRRFRLGDRVRVRAERIDPIFHRVEFAVLSAPPGG
ncbi:MAG TPA: RNB domain-containing ribonuclease [Candidatus Acidoferrales bacterium]|nr:RNB domain-containing ribonuclease [Candidatus Acidoferrales bacterium]